MLLYNIPLLMVLAFLGLTLVIGLCVSQKQTTFREYAVGNKRFQTITLVVTLLATIFGGGSLMRSTTKVHSLGLYFIIYWFGLPFSFYMTSLVAWRMGPFLQHLSIAETMGVYGKWPRVITALLTICNNIGVFSIQIQVMASSISMCIDSIHPNIIVILSTLVLITYTMLGGIRSVTITDVLQFVTFITIIALIAKLIFININKSTLEIILFLQEQEKFQWKSLLHFNKKIVKLVTIMISFFIPDLTASFIQVGYMASSAIQVKKVFTRASFLNFFITSIIMLIGVFTFVYNPVLAKEEIWTYIISNMSPFYKGCIIISVLGLAMSTSDSFLHTASIMVSHDIMESIRGINRVPDTHKLLVSKLTAVVSGLLAMVVTIYYNNLFELSMFVFSFCVDFFFTVVIAPFLLMLFGFRGTSRTALIGMTTGILTSLAWNQWIEPITGIDNQFICTLANGLAMMAAHYLLPQPAGKGWVGLSDQQKRMQQLMKTFDKTLQDS
ncbi:MAG: sodium:solute symporter family protein [Candidatus Cardinium sp.]|nr:sodium:solute symporter family protein [Candidatus Cardinium sp.]